MTKLSETRIQIIVSEVNSQLPNTEVSALVPSMHVPSNTPAPKKEKKTLCLQNQA